MTTFNNQVDVLICGAGPVGLLVGIGLQRLGISTCIVERLEKSRVAMYGRACTLYPRTLEYLDQYELLQEMEQVGLIARNSVNYGKNGERIVERGWHDMFNQMGDTLLKYILNIRLKYSEDIFEAAYKEEGGRLLTGTEMTMFEKDTNSKDGYSNVHVKDKRTGENQVFTSRIIVGADGGRSLTSELAKITSTTEETELRWVRIDAVIDTDMPDSQIGFASLESKTHGNILWCSLDHGRSRIGFALTPEMQKKYGHTMTEEQVILEAKECMAPFRVDFVKVDWYTVYGIRQSVADNYIKDQVILAGDACHTHSSGTAQGMNTGVHDAVNLTWKLAGILKGYLKPDILQTYESERRATAQKLINFDRTYSQLITGRVPPDLEGKATDVNALLTQCWQDGIQFQIGLGIHYDINVLNKAPTAGVVMAGSRMPDVLVYRPGLHVPIRLHEVIHSRGWFIVVVFAGEPLLTQRTLVQLQEALGPGGAKLVHSTKVPLRQVTIIAGNKAQSDAALGIDRFGRTLYDHDHGAHMRYGMTIEGGGIAVSRPDGILGFACRLDQAADVIQYFKDIQA